jgi:hypothetical protein
LGRNLIGAAKHEAGAKMQSLPISIFNCPSRRLARPHPNAKRWKVLNSIDAETHARSDYVANAGDVFDIPVALIKQISTYEEADASESLELSMNDATGICYMRSIVRPSDVIDGFAKTYFSGEKYLKNANYKNGQDDGDDSSMYQGHDFDILRWTSVSIQFSRARFGVRAPTNAPKRDGSEAGITQFGSPHLSGFNATLRCTGNLGIELIIGEIAAVEASLKRRQP